MTSRENNVSWLNDERWFRENKVMRIISVLQYIISLTSKSVNFRTASNFSSSIRRNDSYKDSNLIWVEEFKNYMLEIEEFYI